VEGPCRNGFLGVAIPEEFGGAGAGHLELCVIAEEMGRALAPVPFSSTVYLAAEAILLAGSDAQKRKWLPLIASGAAIGTLALFEGKGNPSPAGIKLSAAGGSLNGVKKPVPDGLLLTSPSVGRRTSSSSAGRARIRLSACSTPPASCRPGTARYRIAAARPVCGGDDGEV